MSLNHLNPKTQGSVIPQPPSITLPKGGGAIKNIGEKFQANPLTGTASYEVPIKLSPGRGGFGPKLSLTYDSGNGNSEFGLGWGLGIPSISRKTQRGLPLYNDNSASDIFIFSGAEDLVPLLDRDKNWSKYERREDQYLITRYCPRIEGLYARIERWFDHESRHQFWKVITKDNITSIYGLSASSCIKNPKDPSQIFQWYLEKTYDDRGNCMIYEYKEENLQNVDSRLSEKHRLNGLELVANTYLKRIKYGNSVPVDRRIGQISAKNKWLFQAILDYGEHGEGIPEYQEHMHWDCRPDPQSSYRSGFEIRTYRLCRRILMYHHFDELGPYPYLVASTHLTHDRTKTASFLVSVQHWAYEKDKDPAPFPPVDFKYSTCQEDPTSIEDLDPGGLHSLDPNQIKWTDLHSEGIPGLFLQHKEAWWYKRNRTVSEPQFGPFKPEGQMPSIQNANQVSAELVDFDSDGTMEFVVRGQGYSGFFEKEKERWTGFKPFEQDLMINWEDPNLRLFDLTGDGLADVLITEDQCFTWYEGKQRGGYHPAKKVQKYLDENKGPNLVFNDASQSIYLTDMTGDGLLDIVRVRNGNIVYWPNKGYARFGAKVTMDHPPLFDQPDQFNQLQVKLADIDGSGTTDVVYIYRDKLSYWINESGNGFSEKRFLSLDVSMDNLHQVQVLDLFGKGTACVVIAHPSPNKTSSIRYIDLMKKGKPYLLEEINNNMGAITRFHYCSSTKFYLEAQNSGRPWITKLPFPVQVIQKTEVIDEIENNRFTTSYAYHHGYYDEAEREFRGFGLVEQWDTETYEEHLKRSGDTIEEELYVPPVYTRTWFHTGFFRDKQTILDQYKSEFYDGDQHAWNLPDLTFPKEWEIDEMREAARALKGSSLCQEVYALDGTEKEKHPYSVTQNNYQIKRVQPKSDNTFAVFDVLSSETLTYHYERNSDDPRISHQMVLKTDDYGHELLTASIGYPRRIPVYDEQAEHGIIITQNEVINKPNEPDFYRLGIGYESSSHELSGLKFEGEQFGLTQIKDAFEQATEIAYEKEASINKVERRILGHQKIFFYNKDLVESLPLGEVSYHVLPYQSRQLAFTSGLLAEVYGDRVDASMLETLGYKEESGDWWATSGLAVFDPDLFFHVVESFDPLGNRSRVEYDLHVLFPVRSINALGSETSSEYNYRVLQARSSIDPNLNGQEVSFDTRGSVIAIAVIGKNGEGDSLEDPTTRMEYELFNWLNHRKPNYSKSMARERHQDPDTPWQISYTYSNGLGKEILTKVQAEDGEAFARKTDGSLKKIASGELVKEYTADRWLGNGRVVLNNKGKPVKQYEPYFSSCADYEDEAEVREYGVTPINHYDPLERIVRTDLPNGTFTQVEFDPWKRVSWDQNDTVLESDWYEQRGAPGLSSSEPADPQERAAWLAARHAKTPQVIHLDYLGRNFMTIEDNGTEGKYTTKTLLDIEGNQQSITDPKGRELARSKTDVLGRQIYSWSVDAGERWILHSLFVEEAEEEGEEDQSLPAFVWDSRGIRRRIEYDALERPHQEWISEKEQTEKLVEWTVFGEAVPDAEGLNLAGQAHLQFDQAGIVKSEVYDFKGNLLSGSQTFAKEYKQTIDWSTYVALDFAQLEPGVRDELETETFRSSYEFDALNRVITTSHPDQSVIKPGYNKANLLEKVSARLKGAAQWTDFVTNIDYDEKGQRQAIYYANGTKTNYRYDPLTFRLTRLFTVRQSDNILLQDLYYTYDPVGNITEIQDEAQQTIYFGNVQVEPSGKYTYDALYRLKNATGRELAGLGQTGSQDIPIQPVRDQQDASALRRYTQTYQYDELGNILQMKHQAVGGNWTRHYRYEANSNRLLETSRSGDLKDGPYSDKYVHDVHGNMTQMPHLADITWDPNDQMRSVDLGGGGKAWYVYDSGGQRIRKVIERNGGKKLERLYLGEVEVYRESQGTTLELERETLHLSDGETRICRIDTLTFEDTHPKPNAQNLSTYTYSNHLGSATLELDEDAAIISYEEYHPFGTTAYRSGRSTAEVSLKRYRYSGKERDDETGLYYYGARSLIPWLGRWSSADPAGFVDGLNVFQFVENNFIKNSDDFGLYTVNEVLKEISTNPKSFGKAEDIFRGDDWYKVRYHSKFGKVYFKGYEYNPQYMGTTEVMGKTYSMTAWNIKFLPITVDEFLGKVKNEKNAEFLGNAALSARDSSLRGKYKSQIETIPSIGEQNLKTAKATGDVDLAEKTARNASETRNQIRENFQKKQSPVGRSISESLDAKRSWADLKEKYNTPGDEIATYEKINSASGRSNATLSKVSRGMKVLGWIGTLWSAYSSGKEIYNASPEDRERVIYEEAGSFVYGTVGGMAGGILGITLASFIVGLMALTGPIAAFAILLGSMIGGIIGGWLMGNYGKNRGRELYEKQKK